MQLGPRRASIPAGRMMQGGYNDPATTSSERSGLGSSLRRYASMHVPRVGLASLSSDELAEAVAMPAFETHATAVGLMVGEVMNPLVVRSFASEMNLIAMTKQQTLKNVGTEPAQGKSPASRQLRAGSVRRIFRESARAVAAWSPRDVAVDTIASLVQFLLTAVIYVSAGQSIVTKVDTSLVYIPVTMMLAGTALGGWILALSSKVPWAVAALDVGFTPLLAKLAEVIWKDVATDHLTGDVVETEAAIGRFVSTFVVASSLLWFAVGCVLWTLGALRVTRLCGYLPYPVTAGMLASIGVSLSKSAWHVATHRAFETSNAWGFASAAAMCALCGASMVAKHRFRVPAYIATPAVVAAGSLVLYGSAFCLVPPAWAGGHPAVSRKGELIRVGAVFNWDAALLAKARGWWPPTAPEFAWRRVSWTAIQDCLVVVLAACALGALKLGIKAGSFSQLFPEAGVDPDSEMRSMGWTNLVNAVTGTAGQAISFSGLKVQQQLGATHKGAALLVPVWCATAWLCGFGYPLQTIPRFVYGALLLELGVDYIDTYLIYPLRRGRNTAEAPLVRPKETTTTTMLPSHQQQQQQQQHGGGNKNKPDKVEDESQWRNFTEVADVAAIFIIVLTSVAAGLLEAITVGLVLCCFFTTLRLSSQPVVVSATSGTRARSTIERTSRALRLLDATADALLLVVLQGCIFFGSAEDVVSVVADTAFNTNDTAREHDNNNEENDDGFGFPSIMRPPPPPPAAAPRAPLRHVIFDVSQCLASFDVTAIAAFERVAALGSAVGFEVFVTPASSKPAKALLRALPRDVAITFYETVDDALEVAEEAMLDAAGDVGASPTGGGARSRPLLSNRDLVDQWFRDAAPDYARNTQALDALARVATVRHFGRDEFVEELGAVAPRDEVALVCSGRLRIINKDGVCVRKLGPGNAFGVADLYGRTRPSAKPSPRSVIGIRPATVIYFHYDALDELERTDPPTMLIFHRVMARSLGQKNRQSQMQHRARDNQGPSSSSSTSSFSSSNNLLTRPPSMYHF